MTDDLERYVGRHDEAIETLKDEVRAIRKDLDEIKLLLSETKGSVRVLIAVGSICGAVGAAVMKFISLRKDL